MSFPEASASTTALRGRERTCAQCGAVYRSPRSSTYCGNACRCRAKRGYSPKVTAPVGAAGLSVVGKALLRLGMAGSIGPATALVSTEPKI